MALMDVIFTSLNPSSKMGRLDAHGAVSFVAVHRETQAVRLDGSQPDGVIVRLASLVQFRQQEDGQGFACHAVQLASA